MTDQSQVDPNAAAPAEEPPRVESKVNGANGAWDGILRLRKQVIANGETVGEIKFREPTGADIERIGNPVTFSFVANGPPRVHMEADVMTQMMAHLAGVPPSTIRQFHPRDWNNGAWLLANFFTPDLFA